jgi:hypothetical protein
MNNDQGIFDALYLIATIIALFTVPPLGIALLILGMF